VALVAGAVACTLPPPYEGGAPDGPTVVVVGDSLVDFGSDAMKADLEGQGWRVSLHGEPSVDTAAVQPRITGASAAQPDAVVIISTANDAFELYEGARSVDDVAASLDRAFSAVDNLPCQVWMLLDEHAWFYGFPQWAPVVNTLVIYRALHHPNVRLLDWRDQVLYHPDWFQPDLFHHTDSGNAAFASALADTLATCPH
jgi:hypothetical protein